MAQFKIKVKHIKKQIEWMYPLLEKLMNDADWRVNEVPREWIQEVIDEVDITAEHMVVFTPVQNKVDGDVPLAWPNSAVVTDGEYDRQKTWEEYAEVTEAGGGYVIRMNMKGEMPGFVDDGALKRWVAEFNGFMTLAEVEAL